MAVQANPQAILAMPELLRRYVTSRFGVTNNPPLVQLKIACIEGYFNIVRLMVEFHRFTENDIKNSDVFRWACKRGRLEIAKWLAEAFRYTTEDGRIENDRILRSVYKCMVYGGERQAVIDWLEREFEIVSDDDRNNCVDMYIEACKDGNLERVIWFGGIFSDYIQEKFNPCDILQYLCENKRLKIIEFLKYDLWEKMEENSCVLSSFCREVCENGDLEIINLLLGTLGSPLKKIIFSIGSFREKK